MWQEKHPKACCIRHTIKTLIIQDQEGDPQRGGGLKYVRKPVCQLPPLKGMPLTERPGEDVYMDREGATVAEQLSQVSQVFIHMKHKCVYNYNKTSSESWKILDLYRRKVTPVYWG